MPNKLNLAAVKSALESSHSVEKESDSETLSLVQVGKPNNPFRNNLDLLYNTLA